MEDNKLTELIKQYEKETKNSAKYEYIDEEGFPLRAFKDAFVLWLANRPTCTPNERKFLDEIRKEFMVNDPGYNEELFIECSKTTDSEHPSILYQSDFESNLPKLVEKKE